MKTKDKLKTSEYLQDEFEAKVSYYMYIDDISIWELYTKMMFYVRPISLRQTSFLVRYEWICKVNLYASLDGGVGHFESRRDGINRRQPSNGLKFTD